MGAVEYRGPAAVAATFVTVSNSVTMRMRLARCFFRVRSRAAPRSADQVMSFVGRARRLDRSKRAAVRHRHAPFYSRGETICGTTDTASDHERRLSPLILRLTLEVVGSVIRHVPLWFLVGKHDRGCTWIHPTTLVGGRWRARPSRPQLRHRRAIGRQSLASGRCEDTRGSRSTARTSS
jgi:hypothetical protein